MAPANALEPQWFSSGGQQLTLIVCEVTHNVQIPICWAGGMREKVFSPFLPFSVFVWQFPPFLSLSFFYEDRVGDTSDFCLKGLKQTGYFWRVPFKGYFVIFSPLFKEKNAREHKITFSSEKEQKLPLSFWNIYKQFFICHWRSEYIYWAWTFFWLNFAMHKLKSISSRFLMRKSQTSKYQKCYCIALSMNRSIDMSNLNTIDSLFI